MNPSTKSVVVCGGGVVGLCCAYYLAKEGHRVTVLERNPEGGDSCAMGNAGFIAASHVIPVAAPGMIGVALKSMRDPSSPFYVKPRWESDFLRWSWLFCRAAKQRRVDRAALFLRDLSRASRALFEDLAAETGNPFALEKRGLFHVCRTHQAWERQAKAAGFVRDLGIEAEVLDARQTASREPGVRMAIVGSVYFPTDCHVIPARFVATLTDLLKKMGVELKWKTEISGWRAHDRRIAAVRTSVGELSADAFVLCGGAWSPAMVGALDLRWPIQAGKGYSLTLDRPRQIPAAPMNFIESRIGVTPMAGALRFAGTMEFSGLNDDIRPERVRRIIQTVPVYFPDFRDTDFDGVKPWLGRRPVSPDGLPYVGRTRRYRNLVAACGHAMLGVTLGPVTGRLVTEIISEKPLSFEIGLLDPDRYA